MSGETQDAVSGLTPDTLRVLLELRIDDVRNLMTEALEAADKRYDQRFEGQEKAVNAALAAAEKAVNAALVAADRAVAKAEIAAEKRFDSVNEFRGQLRDQATTLLPRAEADARLLAIEQRITRLEGMQTRISGRDEGKTVSAGAVANAITILIAIAAVVAAFLRH